MAEPATIAEEMNQLADWLDEADPIVTAYFDAHGVVRTSEGDEIQKDLRRISQWLEAHPGIDQLLWAATRREDP